MIKIENTGILTKAIQTNTLDSFLDLAKSHANNRTFFNMPRFYVNSLGRNFNTIHMLTTTEYKQWYDVLESEIVKFIQNKYPGYNHIRESITSIGYLSGNNKPFIAKNFLDSICIRVHVVLAGNGSIITEGSDAINFKIGNILILNQSDYVKTSVIVDNMTVHQVFCISHEKDKDTHNWDLFASKDKIGNIDD